MARNDAERRGAGLVITDFLTLLWVALGLGIVLVALYVVIVGTIDVILRWFRGDL